MIPLFEKALEAQIKEFLEWDGWIVRKREQNFSERKRKVVGESGMPDLEAIRYDGFEAGPIPKLYTPVQVCALCQVMWLEIKRLLPSKRGKTWGRATRAAIRQRAWHTLERKRGALTLIAGEDFPCTIEGFKEFYAKSGLQRRVAA